MKKIVFGFLAAAALLGCKKESVSPVASFTFARSAADEIRLGVSDTARVISRASNASSVTWDLGDGRTITDEQPVLSYAKAGTYMVTLTAKGPNGKLSTTTKKIVVLNRVLKSIVINNVFWNNTDPMYAQAGWPLTNKADVYVKIQLLAKDQMPATGLNVNAPLIYQSPVLTNLDKDTRTPQTINVNSKVVFDRSLVDDRRYLISLMAKNAAGEYVLVNNWYSGSYQNIRADDVNQNTFEISTGLFSTLNLKFDFE